MSALDPQFGVPNAPIATRIDADDPDQFGVPALKRSSPSLTGLSPVWAGWFNKLRLWLYHPYSLAYQGTTNQTLTTGVAAVLSFDTNNISNDVIHSTTVNPTRFTAPVAGFYRIWAQVGVVATAAGTLQINFQVNGSVPSNPALVVNTIQNGALSNRLQLSGGWFLNANDYVEFTVTQTTGVNQVTVLGATAGSIVLETQP